MRKFALLSLLLVAVLLVAACGGATKDEAPPEAAAAEEAPAEEAAAEDAHSNAYAECAETNQKCDGNRRKSNNSFHHFLLQRTKSILLNFKLKFINAIPMPSLNTLWSAS